MLVMYSISVLLGKKDPSLLVNQSILILFIGGSMLASVPAYDSVFMPVFVSEMEQMLYSSGELSLVEACLLVSGAPGAWPLQPFLTIYLNGWDGRTLYSLTYHSTVENNE